MTIPDVGSLSVKIFADGADVAEIARFAANPVIRGFTTNPTLMRKAGVNDYRAFAADVLRVVTGRPISFEVFSDDFDEMERQAHEIASWGTNVYAKIPVTNTAGVFSGPLIRRLSDAGVRVNVTALLTAEQVGRVAECLSSDVPSFVSIFAGRIADTGRDPVPVIAEALALLRHRAGAELIWASPRELLNLFQASEVGCHVITATGDILAKLPLVGKSLEAFSLETVKMFRRDAVEAGYMVDVVRRPFQKKKVFVTGGAGYVGCVLVPKLLEAGYRVTVFDLMLFGDQGLPSHPDLEVVRGDIRDTAHVASAVRGAYGAVHLAAISNDPSFELDPDLSRSINFDSFEPMVLACKAAGVHRFVYASTSSVYGVSDAPEVTEEHPLVPLTDYNKYKGLSEPYLLKHQSPGFTTTVLRPATVFGYSPRMRFDLTINILTNHAVNRGIITVFGGTQKRPNIHIDDVADLYVSLLEAPEVLIAGETFNAGYENHTVAELADLVRRVVEEEMPDRAPIRIETTPSSDLRSYHVSSRKIAQKLGWRPKHTIEDGVRDLCRAFQSGLLPRSLEDERYINVKAVKALALR